MKKIIFIVQLCVLVSISSFAQIKIANNENVGIGLSSGTTPLSPLSVGGAGYSDAVASITSYKDYALRISSSVQSGPVYGIYSTSSSIFGSCIAVQGIGGNIGFSSATAIGVRGIAIKEGFGVSGLLDGPIKGAAIYGGVGSTETSVTGLYAGYFDGNVKIEASYDTDYGLSLDKGGASFDAVYGIYSSTSNNSGLGIALQGRGGTTYPYSTGLGIGVRGIALKQGYGVSGLLDGTNGAGIYGGTGNTEVPITGLYAGYFNGNVVVTGTINGVDISNSDIRYKQDIQNLDTQKSLKDVLTMRPIEYRLKQQYTEYKEEDVVKQHPVYDEKSEMFQKKHYGLIAQELQELYPDLVYSDDKGYLSINYTELIPLLIQSIQELNRKVELLENAGSAKKSDADAIEKKADTKNMILTK